MAITVQRVATYAAPSGGSTSPSLSVQVDAGAGNLAILLITAHSNSAAGQQDTFARDGQSFNLLGNINSGDFSTIKAWFLRGPNTGTVDITSVTGGLSQGFAAVVLEGVSQSADPSTVATNNADSLNITAVANSMVFDGVVCRNASGVTWSPGANQTEDADFSYAVGGGGAEGRLCVTHETGSAGTITMSETASGGEELSHIAVVVLEAAGGGGLSLLSHYSRPNVLLRM